MSRSSTHTTLEQTMLQPHVLERLARVLYEEEMGRGTWDDLSTAERRDNIAYAETLMTELVGLARRGQ